MNEEIVLFEVILEDGKTDLTIAKKEDFFLATT